MHWNNCSFLYSKGAVLLKEPLWQVSWGGQWHLWFIYTCSGFVLLGSCHKVAHLCCFLWLFLLPSRDSEYILTFFMSFMLLVDNSSDQVWSILYLFYAEKSSSQTYWSALSWDFLLRGRWGLSFEKYSFTFYLRV